MSVYRDRGGIARRCGGALMRGRWLTVIAFVVTVTGFSLPEKGAAVLGVAIFATDLGIRARKALRTPDPPV
jgi:hypothetical protein